MANDTTMYYGNYQFSPVPLLNLTTEYFKTADGMIIGSQVKASIDGTLIPVPMASGIVDTMTLRANLINAFQNNGLNFKVYCGSNPLIDVYPRINGPIAFKSSSDNWTKTIPYSLELEFDAISYITATGINDTNAVGLEPLTLGQEFIDMSFDQLANMGYTIVATGVNIAYVREASENWGFEFIEDKAPYTIYPVPSVPDTQYLLGKLSHSVSAKGRSHYTGTGVQGVLSRPAWEEAKEFVLAKLDDIDNTTYLSNIPLNHARSISINETDGTYGINESWTIVNSGLGVAYAHAIEDFTISNRYSLDNQNVTVSIEGSVQGLESRTYDGEEVLLEETKYDAAARAWTIVYGRLYNRCQWAYDSMSYGRGRNLSTIPANYSIGKHPSQGIITYSYEYNDRPSNCIPGSLSENISINDNNPSDVIAQLVVLGRKAGPVLQSLGTKTARTTSVNVEVVMPLPYGGSNCTATGLYLWGNPRTAVYTNVLCPIQQALMGDYNQVFLTQDSENWTPKNGRYSRNVTWTIQKCADTSSPSVCP